MADDDLKQLLERVETKIDSTAQNVRHELKATVEHVMGRFDVVAESVANVDQKLDRMATDLRQEMRSGFSETQAMIKFSHAELDRRVRTLEENQRTLEDAMADLQARVERLESSPH